MEAVLVEEQEVQVAYIVQVLDAMEGEQHIEPLAQSMEEVLV